MRLFDRTRALVATVMFTAVLLALAIGWAATALAVDPGNPLWTRAYGGARNQDFLLAAACPGGDVVVAGVTDKTGYKVVVARYSSSGARRWLKVIDATGTSVDVPMDLAVDRNGNAVVACVRDVGGGASSFLVCKYLPKGRRAWKRTLDGGAGGANYPQALALGTSGDAYVTGRTTLQGAVLGSLTARLRARDGKVMMRCALSGAHTLGLGKSLAVDTGGNVYAAGSGDRGDGRDEMVTVKIKPRGQVAWMREVPGAGTDRTTTNKIALGAGGRLYVVGTTSPAGPSRTLLVVHFSTAGAERWRDTYDVPGGALDSVGSATTDRAGNLFVVGAAQPAGPSPSHAYVARWTPSKGRWVYVKPDADTASTQFAGVVADQAGGCWAGGTYGIASGTPGGIGCLYAARVSRSGGLRWEQVQVLVGRSLSGKGMAACSGGLAIPGSAWIPASAESDAVITVVHR
jgi:hypothetical protein